jgi:hypothetical protein
MYNYSFVLKKLTEYQSIKTILLHWRSSVSPAVACLRRLNPKNLAKEKAESAANMYYRCCFEVASETHQEKYAVLKHKVK